MVTKKCNEFEKKIWQIYVYKNISTQALSKNHKNPKNHKKPPKNVQLKIFTDKDIAFILKYF